MSMEMYRDGWYGGELEDNTYRWHTQFENGYGASVVSAPGTYGWSSGLFELAVTHGRTICYRTPITSDVEGHKTHKEIGELMERIEALWPNELCSHHRRDGL